MSDSEGLSLRRAELALTLVNDNRPGIEWHSPDQESTLHYLAFSNGVRYFRLLSVDNVAYGGILAVRRYMFRENDGRIGKVIKNELVVAEVESDATDFEAVKDQDRFQIINGLAEPTVDDELALDEQLLWASRHPGRLLDSDPLPGGFI